MATTKRVGSRSGKYGSKRAIDDDSVAWAFNESGKFTIFLRENEKGESGPDIVMSCVQQGRYGGSSVAITDMTEEELNSLKVLFAEAAEWALPVIRRRDAEAQDEFDKGNDTFKRIYRQVSQLVFRQRPSSEHREGVFDGSEDVHEGGSRRDDSDGGV